jgi:hypothetical protein
VLKVALQPGSNPFKREVVSNQLVRGVTGVMPVYSEGWVWLPDHTWRRALLVGCMKGDTLKTAVGARPRKAWCTGTTEEQRQQQLQGVLRQLVTLVAAMHSRGVAHCDLSGNNILLDRETRQVSVIDLGLARCIPQADEPPEVEVREPGLRGAVGMPEYCSPSSQKGVGHGALSDIFHLGSNFRDLVQIAQFTNKGNPLGPAQSWEGIPADLHHRLTPAQRQWLQVTTCLDAAARWSAQRLLKEADFLRLGPAVLAAQKAAATPQKQQRGLQQLAQAPPTPQKQQQQGEEAAATPQQQQQEQEQEQEQEQAVTPQMQQEKQAPMQAPGAGAAAQEKQPQR